MDRKRRKRLLSMLLALMLLLGALPGGTMAAEAAGTGTTGAARAASPAFHSFLAPSYAPAETAGKAAAADCACADCTCLDCTCAGGECLCSACGSGCACTDGSCLNCGSGSGCACGQEQELFTWGFPVQEDTGERFRPSRSKAASLSGRIGETADPLDERDEDTYCPGCKRNHDDCDWFCDDCNWCDECIASGDCGIGHCGECQSCDVNHYCGFCTDDEGYSGDWLVCFDCARDSSRHCSLCQDTHLVFGYYCESCEACGNCIADGTSEAQHCTVCHACDPDYCQACTEERTDSSGSYCLCMSCVEDLGMHCEVCDGCYTSGDQERCTYSDLNICVECCKENDFHCDNCGDHVYDWCFASGEYNGHCQLCMYEDSGFMECILCGQVWCDFCSQGVTFDRGEYVGICEECIDERNLWCPYCETVDEGLEWCADGGEHCIECCEQWLCDNCGRCTDALGIEVCPDCGLCVECCLENAEAEGCSCGDYCVEGSEWNEHFCESCGTCFDDVDQCDECMLCADCCADNSDCSDDMCVEDSEYDEHFCVDCGACFHDVDPCDDCATAGEYLCVECCAARTESYSNCEHGICMNSWEWPEHYCDTHDCCYEDCSDDPTIHTHSWGADDLCTICGKNKDGKPVIRQQPADNAVTVFNEKDPQYAEGESSWPTVTFSVRAEANEGEELYFQWYNKRDGKVSGATDSKLVVTVQPDDCYITTLNGFADINTYYCVVTNENGSVKSNEVKLIANHRYDRWARLMDGVSTDYYIYNNDGTIADTITSIASTGHTHNCVGHNCNEYDKTEAHSYAAWEVVQEATVNHGGLLKRTCLQCGDCDYKQLPNLAVHDHVWVTGLDATNKYMHSQVCSVCGIKTQSEPHTFGDWTETKRATEESTGKRERTCSVCGFKETEDTPKLAHKHLQQYKAGKIVCDEGVTWEYVWGVTGTRADEDYHFKKCIVQIDDGAGGKTECGEIDRATRLPHDYTAWVFNESTKTFSRTCVDCGYVQTVTYTDDGKYYPLSSSSADFYDALGNKIYIAKAGQLITARPNSDAYENLFQYWTTTGLIITSEQQHSIPLVFRMPGYTVSVGIQRGLCVEPSVSQAEGIAHMHWRLNDDGTWGHMGTEDSSTYIDPTCTAEGREALLICRVCGDYIKGIGGEPIEPLGHSYELDESTVRAATCTDYGYSGDSVCTRCGDRIKGQRTAKLGHNYASEATRIREADCIHSALYGYVCQNEGCEKYQRAESPEPALGHDWGEWEWVKLPTATEDGEMECFCSRCKNGKSKNIPRGTNTGIVEEEITDLGTIVVQVPKAGQSIYVTDDSIGYLKSTSYPSPTLPEDCHYTQYRVLREPWENIDDEHINDLKYLAEVDYGTRIAMEPKVLYKFPESASEISVKIVDRDGNEFLRDAPLEKGGVFKVTVSGGNVYIKLNYMPPHNYNDPYFYLEYDYSDPTHFTVSNAYAIFQCTSGGADYRADAEFTVTPDPAGCLLCSMTVVGPDGKTYADTRFTEHMVNDAAAVAATCTEAGHEAGYRCSLCGKYFTGYDGITELAEGEGVIAALGHDWSAWENDGAGKESRSCSRCAETETRDTAALAIVQQPQSVEVAREGDVAEVTVIAQGDELTYQWYVKKVSASKFSKSSITGATYSVTMTQARDGNQLYCVITDKYGNSVTTETVTISIAKMTPLAIVQEPQSVEVAQEGDVAEVTVIAQGDELTYQWYVKKVSASKFSKSSITGATYSVTMTQARDGNRLYCVITDKYGNSVTTETVTISIAKMTPLAIVQEPQSVEVAQEGDVAEVTVTAQGDELTYQWYVKKVSASKFSKSSITGATYSVTMTQARDGNRLYCVITDKYGNSVTTETVTISIAEMTPLAIVQEPQSVEVAREGDVAEVTVIAQGDELTYQWYVKKVSASKFSKSSITGAIYSVTMTQARDGNRLYCVITDKYGNSVTTETVTISIAKATPLAIVQEPQSVEVAQEGDVAEVTVTAQGDELTYQWYVKKVSASKFSKSSITGATYSVTMTQARDGNQLYCVITDKYGNSVTTETVTISIAKMTPLAIVQEPQSVEVAWEGDIAEVTVIAQGDELTYQWYVKKVSASKFSKSSITGATYSVTMTQARDGNRLYCVITDKYGNSVTTDTVTISIA